MTLEPDDHGNMLRYPACSMTYGPSGPVRPPLQEPAAEHVQKLAELIALGDTMLDTAAP
jgi:hypothetical protein